MYLEVVAVLGRGHLGLDARLEALLRLRHELVAHGLPRRVVGGRRGDGHRGEVADLDLRTCERAAREPAHAATGEAWRTRTCDSTWVFTIGRMVSLRTQNRHAIVSILRKRGVCEPVREASAHYRLDEILTCAGKRRDVSGQALRGC